MITAVIIDDENKARESLMDDLAVYCPEIQVVGEAGTIKSGIDIIVKSKPQLLFLDIEMTDGTGFDLLKGLARQQGGIDKLNTHVIFTTAHDKYAIQAIKFSALDYLMKPIDPDELVAAIRKVKPIPVHSKSDNMNALLEHNIQSNRTKKIVLTTMDSVFIYPIDEIVRCESQRNYTLFYIKNEKDLLVSTTLGEYENLLTEYGFFRSHHSHLINLKHLKKFVKTDGGYIVMNDGANVPLAQRKKEQFMKLLAAL
jgi:two-component system LytT family response regulator